jgi:Neuraminidase (sialidase)
MNRVGESRMTAKIQHNVYYTKKSQDKLHKQLSTRKAIIKKDIDVMDKQQVLLNKQQVSLVTRKRALEKELVQLDHNAKRLHNNYTHYIKTRNTKGNYTKVHGKWITKKNTP